MTNAYYSSPSDAAAGAKVRSSDINSVDSAVDAAFDKLPTEAHIKQGKINYAADTSAVADAYVVTLPYTFAYTDGAEVCFKPLLTNGGACSINVNGLGVVSVKKYDGTDPAAGDIRANGPTTVRYNSSTGYFHLSQSGAAGPAGTLGGTATAAINEVKGADIASAATINLNNATGNLVHVTGTTGISAITLAAGAERTVIFDGALTLTHSSSLLLPGGANITTAANDRMKVRGDTAGAIVVNYTKSDGRAVIASATPRRAISSTDTIVVTDLAALIDCSGTFTLSFAAAATLGNGFHCFIRNTSTGDVTIDPNGAETCDGLGSFVMYPGESRVFQSDGTSLRSAVISPFQKTFTSSGTFTKPPGYNYFGGIAWSAGSSGQRTNNTGAASSGGSGGGSFPFNFPASIVGTTESVSIGAGGAAVTGVAGGNAGGNTTFGSLLTVYGGATALAGGAIGVGSAITSSTAGVGFEGMAAAASGTRNAIYGGTAPSNNATTNSGSSLYGGAAGGSVDGSGNIRTPGPSTFGGGGGAASIAGNGTDGTAPGGGGGATQTGTQSGAGARGELRIWGIC